MTAAGGEARAFGADLSDPQGPGQLVDQVVAAFGELHLLVASAANYERTPLASFDEGAWDRAHALNLRAPMLLARRAAQHLRQASGSMVVITDTSRRAPYRDYLPYGVSKAGAHQLMRQLAIELAPDVRVNAVAPGTVMPPDDMDKAQVTELVSEIPLGRAGSAQDVADAVLHLATASFITGQELVVDGGRSLA